MRHFAGIMLLLLTGFAVSTLSPALGKETQKTEPGKPWTGTLADGREITKQDLDEILKGSKLYGESCGEKGQWADLSNANLNRVNLSGVFLLYVRLSNTSLDHACLSKAVMLNGDLKGANLQGANLSGANILVSDFSGAILMNSNLSEATISAKMIRANLMNANLSKAHVNADLSGANLEFANLKDTTFWDSDLSGCIFEPKPGLGDITNWVSPKGLSTLTYKRSTHGLVELREIFKKAGMRYQEREITFALNHTRRLILLEDGKKEWAATKILDSLFNLVCFEWTCGYGLNPGRPLQIMGLGIFVFALPYMLALRSRKRETGIWVLLLPDRVLGRAAKDRPYKLTKRTPFRPMPEKMANKLIARFWRALRMLRLGFYFSLLSAFSLGWRELNVGNWITRIQKREYTLRATGWVRTVAGLQSLLSVYMLALWVLSYFGRPFD